MHYADYSISLQQSCEPNNNSGHSVLLKKDKVRGNTEKMSIFANEINKIDNETDYFYFSKRFSVGSMCDAGDGLQGEQSTTG